MHNAEGQSGAVQDVHGVQIGLGVEVQVPASHVYTSQRTSFHGFFGPHWASEVHGPHVPALSQTCPAGQGSQVTKPPQPFGQVPHSLPSWAQVFGVQDATQWFALSQVLPLVQVRVGATGGEQTLVCAALDDATIFERKYLIGTADG